MVRQHIENLFRRYKGKRVAVRSLSGSEYQGQVGEITNDYVLLKDSETETFVLYEAIESIVVIDSAKGEGTP